MKKILLIALAMLTFGNQVLYAGKKEKKEKKELKWDWDGTMSGNATIDNYLLTIDTLYNRVQVYKETMGSYDMLDDTLFVNEKVYIMTHMANSSGELVSRSRVNWQCAQAVLEGGLIILDMTNAGLSSATAALELPNLGLKALKFGKYVKGGPAVISEGIKSIKSMRGQYMANSRKWKAMKDGAIEDPTTIGYDGFTPEIVKKLNKCYYIKEMREDDPEYAEVIARYKAKDPEVIAQENKDFADKLDSTTVLPEDKSKELDEVPDLEEELEKEGIS